MWKEGSIKAGESEFHFWMKYYDEGSVWGIDQGRISKLMLKRDRKITANYDRGWDVDPVDEDTRTAVNSLLASDN